MPLTRSYSDLFWGSFTLFLGWNLVASQINHIDDADEPFGYWEPLHYLLYGSGLQTWEYAPEYAIRSYAFVFPFYLLCVPLKVYLQLPKISIFYTLRAILGTFSAYSSSRFIQAVAESVSFQVAALTLLLMLTAPGIFFASTAFLPSAVAASLLMLSIASWLQSDFPSSILMGCIAVLATGWPFIGALFVPIGLHMVYIVLISNDESVSSSSNGSNSRSSGSDGSSSGISSSIVKKRTTVAAVYSWPILGQLSDSRGLLALLQLIVTGAALVFLVTGVVALIDHHYYQKWTLPPLNIFLYNAVSSSSGDELYGIEPASYYAKNLLLTMGTAWPLTVLYPLTALFNALVAVLFRDRDTTSNQVDDSGGNSSEFSNSSVIAAGVKKFVIIVSAVAWLLLLFPRPHKEERFMYPVYPLLAFTGGVTVSELMSALSTLLIAVTTNASSSQSPPSTIAAVEQRENSGSNGSNKSKRTRASSLGKVLVHLLLLLLAASSGALFMMRIVSSFVNYKGYMQLWKDTNGFISASEQLKQRGVGKSDLHSAATASISAATDEVDTAAASISVCTGQEWYQFPSSFFLPPAAALQFIEDGFQGVLPQHFRHVAGTSAIPLQPFNSMNKEERSRYVPIESCDYLIVIIDYNKPLYEIMAQSISESADDDAEDVEDQISIAAATAAVNDRDSDSSGTDSSEQHTALRLGLIAEVNGFELITAQPVLSAEYSLSTLGRAFYVPSLSARTVKFKQYALYKNKAVLKL